MINTFKFAEKEKINPRESDNIKQKECRRSKENLNLSGDVQRAEKEIPTDAIGRMNGALSTWEEVAEDNIINKEELVRLRELATADPQNDIYHSFLEHVANSVQQKFDTTPRSFLFRAGLKLRACQETISLITEDRRCIHKYTFSDLLEEFGRIAPKLEPEEEIKRFKEVKAMVDSGRASVLTLLVDASRFKQVETITAALVLMASVCKTSEDARLLANFSNHIAEHQEHRERCPSKNDFVWAFTETCRRDLPIEALLLTHEMTSYPFDPWDSESDRGPFLILKHRKMKEGDFEKLAALTSGRAESQFDVEDALKLATLMLSKGATIDTAVKAVRSYEYMFDCAEHRDLLTAIMEQLKNPKKYPTAAQELAQVIGSLNRRTTLHREVLATLEEVKTPVEGLLDILDAILKEGDDRSRKAAFLVLDRLLDREDLTPAQVDRAIEIATQTNSDNNKRRVQRILEKAKNCGLASPKAIEKADKTLETETKAKRRSKMHSAENLLREVD